MDTASAVMALRPAPRTAPFTDFEETLAELSKEFNVDVSTLPAEAKAEWSESELQMWFASGGVICPPSNPKLRASAQKLQETCDLRSTEQKDADQKLDLVREAAMKAPWW